MIWLAHTFTCCCHCFSLYTLGVCWHSMGDEVLLLITGVIAFLAERSSKVSISHCLRFAEQQTDSLWLFFLQRCCSWSNNSRRSNNNRRGGWRRLRRLVILLLQVECIAMRDCFLIRSSFLSLQSISVGCSFKIRMCFSLLCLLPFILPNERGDVTRCCPIYKLTFRWVSTCP